MRIKNIIDFDIKLNLDCPIPKNKFQQEFRKRFIHDKESDLKGEIENDYFELSVKKKFYQIGDFSILTGKIKKNKNNQSIECNIGLSEMLVWQTLLGIILGIIGLFVVITKGNLDLKLLGIIALLIGGFFVVTFYQLYKDKYLYKAELNRLIKENIENNKSTMANRVDGSARIN